MIFDNKARIKHRDTLSQLVFENIQARAIQDDQYLVRTVPRRLTDIVAHPLARSDPIFALDLREVKQL